MICYCETCRVDGVCAGSMCYYAPSDTRDVGAVEFVSNDQQFRRRGVGAALLGTLIRHFTGHGGRALYLCTDNPIAGHLYERHGFRYHVGDGMRYLAPSAADFDARWFAGGVAATIREAHWGDLAHLCVLYNHSDPAWLLKDPLSAAFRDTRYESHFVRVMRRIEDGRGAFLVLEAPGSRVVGAVALCRRDTFYEQHVATLSFRVAPAYFDRARELLDLAAARAASLGVRQLALPVAAGDTSSGVWLSRPVLSRARAGRGGCAATAALPTCKSCCASWPRSRTLPRTGRSSRSTASATPGRPTAPRTRVRVLDSGARRVYRQRQSPLPCRAGASSNQTESDAR